METRIFGYVPSKMDGTEHIFGVNKPVELPNSYTYKAYMPSVIDQGELSICVPCSLSAYLNWRTNLKDGEVRDNKIALMDIYKIRTNKGEGMTFKDALRYLKHEGVKSKDGVLKINSYGLVKNVYLLKYALVMNGPCVGALPVYSSDDDFWKPKSGYRLKGYHAISIIGYDEEGFFIRNSWGTNFGKNGYTHIPYKDCDALMELWTIID